ncbi:hypothetical protein [Pseudaestuariivita sp.]|uniref:hypothetical protein n=1 Tax=Pseudaestuariivita sp. TaxID=2211669 RepID=UPI004059DE40
MRLAASLICLVTLSACAMPKQEPIVQAFNGDSVSIVQPMFAAFTDAELDAKANSICQRGNRKFAERVSQRHLPNYEGTLYLFLCLNDA